MNTDEKNICGLIVVVTLILSVPIMVLAPLMGLGMLGFGLAFLGMYLLYLRFFP